MPNLPAKEIKETTILQTILNEVEAKLGAPSASEITLLKANVMELERRHSDLKSSEVRYRRLFETAKDGILILDGDTGRITDANPFIQDMLGYPKDELVGKALWEIGPVREIAASQAAMRQLQNSEYIRYEDIPLETKSGEHKQVEFVSNVYAVNGWRVIQCNIRDITARKLAEAEARKANDELLVLVDELQWRDREMQLLNHMNDLLQSCITHAEAYRVISLTAGELFPGQSGCLAILQGKGQPLEVVVRWGVDELIESSFVLEDCWALRRGQMHEVLHPETDLLCNHFIHPPEAGYLCLPLTVQGETLGVLCLIDSATRKGEHQLSLQQLAVTVGETIKLSISNLKLRDQLRQQAIHDPLTGLFNRRYLDETLPRELDVALRRAFPLCIVMLDIDGFKQFNDTFGHGPGDSLLRELGRILGDQLRKSDIACRYGGDEFLLVMPDSSVADTQERMEQIRTLIRALQIQRGEQRTITISIGIACMPEHGMSEAALLRAADEALYAAKQAGRDRIVLYQPAPPL